MHRNAMSAHLPSKKTGATLTLSPKLPRPSFLPALNKHATVLSVRVGKEGYGFSTGSCLNDAC
eukprot:2709511-Amphidinium_carterae.1